MKHTPPLWLYLVSYASSFYIVLELLSQHLYFLSSALGVTRVQPLPLLRLPMITRALTPLLRRIRFRRAQNCWSTLLTLCWAQCQAFCALPRCSIVSWPCGALPRLLPIHRPRSALSLWR